jgi:hypothetical protein
VAAPRWPSDSFQRDVPIELPPGPPVLQAPGGRGVWARPEICQRLAEQTRELFARTPGVVDIDWYVESAQPQQVLVIDKEGAREPAARRRGMRRESLICAVPPCLVTIQCTRQLHLPRKLHGAHRARGRQPPRDLRSALIHFKSHRLKSCRLKSCTARCR